MSMVCTCFKFEEPWERAWCHDDICMVAAQISSLDLSFTCPRPPTAPATVATSTSCNDRSIANVTEVTKATNFLGEHWEHTLNLGRKWNNATIERCEYCVVPAINVANQAMPKGKPDQPTQHTTTNHLWNGLWMRFLKSLPRLPRTPSLEGYLKIKVNQWVCCGFGWFRISYTLELSAVDTMCKSQCYGDLWSFTCDCKCYWCAKSPWKARKVKWSILTTDNYRINTQTYAILELNHSTCTAPACHVAAFSRTQK